MAKDYNMNWIVYLFGFRKSHSTQQTIIGLVDRITKSLDKGDIVIAILLDLRKAFNTVDHRMLFKKLYAYGIWGPMLQLFKSHLSGWGWGSPRFYSWTFTIYYIYEWYLQCIQVIAYHMIRRWYLCVTWW